MASKNQFATEFQSLATDLSALVNKARDIDATYFDRGYNSGGSDPIIDADVSSLGILAADITSGVTFCQQLVNFAGNVAVTQGDYQNTLDKLRTDI